MSRLGSYISVNPGFDVFRRRREVAVRDICIEKSESEYHAARRLYSLK
jgi:hypothetical protein